MTALLHWAAAYARLALPVGVRVRGLLTADATPAPVADDDEPRAFSRAGRSLLGESAEETLAWMNDPALEARATAYMRRELAEKEARARRMRGLLGADSRPRRRARR